MLKFSTLIAISLLAGCAAIETPNANVPGMSVGASHTINCGGMERDWTACYQRASDLCGNHGYSILSRSEDSSPIFFLARSSSSPQRTNYQTRSAIYREIYVECEKPKPTSWVSDRVEAAGWQDS